MAKRKMILVWLLLGLLVGWNTGWSLGLDGMGIASYVISGAIVLTAMGYMLGCFSNTYRETFVGGMIGCVVGLIGLYGFHGDLVGPFVVMGGLVGATYQLPLLVIVWVYNILRKSFNLRFP